MDAKITKSIVEQYTKHPNNTTSLIVKELLLKYKSMRKPSRAMEVEFNGHVFTITISPNEYLDARQFRSTNSGLITFSTKDEKIYYVDRLDISLSPNPTRIGPDGSKYYNAKADIINAIEYFDYEKYLTNAYVETVEEVLDVVVSETFNPTMFTYQELLEINKMSDDVPIKQYLQNTIGVYLLMCKRTNAQYIGSVYKSTGFLGRWVGGHLLKGGDAIYLKEHITSNGWADMIFCIEEIVGDKATALRSERKYKGMYQTRNMTGDYGLDMLKLNAN